MTQHELLWLPRPPSPEEPSFGPQNVAGLEIGGGPHPLRLKCKQFDAIDWSERTGMHYDTGDARQLPYADATFGYVFSSNLLEHFPRSETPDVLTEWARVLYTGGTLDLVVPDFLGILTDFFESRCSWNETAERLLGSYSYEGNDHKVAFTLSSFAGVIDCIPELELVKLEPSHAGGGIHAVAYRK